MIIALALASSLASTPYSFRDALDICARHERFITTESGADVMHGWDYGFEFCRDLHEWAREAENRQTAKDKRVIDEMQKALGPYPAEMHVK